MTDTTYDHLERLRAICLALPEVTERPSHGAPSWFVRGKSTFVMAWLDGHHKQEFPHFWCAAFPGAQEELVELEPDVFFRPPYVGHRGWLGIRLNRDYPWDEIARHCREAYTVIAPKRLAATVDIDEVG